LHKKQCKNRRDNLKHTCPESRAAHEKIYERDCGPLSKLPSEQIQDVYWEGFAEGAHDGAIVTTLSIVGMEDLAYENNWLYDPTNDMLVVSQAMGIVISMTLPGPKGLSQFGGRLTPNPYALSSKVAKRIHKNSRDYVGATHVYAITRNGKAYKIGQSARGKCLVDGLSKRAERQVRCLNRIHGGGFESKIIKDF